MSDRSDVFALLERYKAGFDEYDDVKIRSCFSWPCTVITPDGPVSIHEPPATTAQMKALKNWHRSVHWEIDVIAASAIKAHVAVRNFERLRSDGTLIECGSGLYVLGKTDQGWKIRAISAIDISANAA